MAAKATGIEVARISVKVSPDTRKFRSELKEQLTAIEKGVKCEIEVKPDGLDKFRAKVKAATEGLEAKVNVKADTAGLRDSIKNTAEKTRSKTKVDVDQNWFKKAFNAVTSKLELPNFGSGINFTGYLVIAAALAAILAPLAGLVTGLLLSLPGLLSLVLTPIAAVALGLDGLKEAASALAVPFQELRDVMSGSIKAQFAPVFETLRPLFDTLKQAMPTVSQGLADMAQSIANVITSPENLKLIGDVISGIGAALSQAAPGIGDFTQALLTLTNNFVNGGALEGVIDWFNGAMKSFNNFITKMDESGQLDVVFQSLGQSLKIIADGLGAIAMIGLDTLSDPEAMMAFTAILKGTVAIIVGLFAASKAALHGVTVGIQWVIEKALQFAAFMSMLGSQINSAFTTVLNFMRTIAASISEAWNTVVGVVGNAIGVIKSTVAGIGSALSGVWNNIVSIASTAWNGVVTAVQGAWDNVISVVQTAAGVVVSFVASLPGQLVSALGDLGGLLVGAGKALMDGLLNGIRSGFEAVKNFVGGIAGWIAANKGPLPYDREVLVPNGEALMVGLNEGLENGFENLLGNVKGMAGKIADAFASGGDPSALLDGFSGKEIGRMEKVLNHEAKLLEWQAKALTYKAKVTGDESLKQQAEALRMRKEELMLQKDMIDLAGEYADIDNSSSSSGSSHPFIESIKEIMKLPNSFADATKSQFLQDVGISGNGAIPAVADWAMGAASNFIFNVSNIDEAMAVQKNQVNKQSLGFVGR